MNNKTSGIKKNLNYFKTIIQSAGFNKDIRELRNNVGIPTNGYGKKIYDKWLKNTQGPMDAPWEWNKKNIHYKLKNLIEKLANRYALMGHAFFGMIFEYLFFNDYCYNYGMFNCDDTCDVTDINEMVDCLHKRKFSKEYYDSFFATKVNAYPIAISISPYASINDIIDFVRKNKDIINNFQKKYKNTEIKIGRFRHGAMSNRNNLIFENKKLPRKQIRQIVKDKLGMEINEIYIRDIISKETRKRKKV